MNFEAKVLHENGIRPRLRKSPLNLIPPIPTWRVPVALRLSNVRCFSELRLQVTYLWSLHSFVSQLTAVWNKHASLGLTQTGCLRLLGIHSSFVTSCTADYSPHSPTTSEPQHGDCGCFKTQQCAMFLRTENASRLYGIWSLHTFVSQLTAVWNKHASLGLTQTGCLRLLGIHSSFVTSCTADYSPHSPTTSEPQHGDCQLL